MKARILGAAVLLALSVMLLNGCVKKDYKPLDAEQFDRKIRAKGAVTEIYTGADAPVAAARSAVTRIEFHNADAGWEGTYYEFSSDDDARSFFNSLMDAADPDMCFDPGGNYASFDFSGANGICWRAKVVGNTFLGIGYQEDDAAAKDAVNKLLTSLGY